METLHDAKYQVLIVDDIPENLQLLSDVLYQEGLEIIIATSGQQAIKAAQSKKPDLILLDIAMPEMDGYQVCEYLKEQNDTKHIPVIFLTAKTETTDIVRGLKAGAVDYVTKPFNQLELLARVKTHLELTQQRRLTENMNNLLEEKVNKRTGQLKTAVMHLTRTNNKYRRANEKLLQLDKAKNDFLFLINHELRTPLNGIIGSFEILKSSLQTAQDKELIGLLEHSTNRLWELSEIALLITTLRAESYKLEIEPFSLAQWLARIIDKITPEANQKNISLAYHYQTDVTVNIDKKLATTCLSMILTNAVKYSPEEERIDVYSSVKNHLLLIDVHDKGTEMSTEKRKKLYDLFTTSNIQSHTQNFGLELATAKLIMDTLGGQISMIDKQQEGVVMRLHFPLHDTESVDNETET